MTKKLDRVTTACRPVHEAYSTGAWALSALGSLAMVAGSNAPSLPFWFITGISGVMGFIRATQSIQLAHRKIALVGRGFEGITTQEALNKAQDLNKYVWLGKGFIWENIHSQLAYDMLREHPDNIQPPDWLCKLYQKHTGIKLADEEARGIGWIHGIEPVEQDIRLQVADFEGHTQILGAPGTGKTRLLEYVIAHAITRQDVVIIIDPKSDKDLEQRARREAERTDQNYFFMSMTRPSESCRIDTMANFSDVTQLATRLAILLSQDASMDTFVAFSWSSINKIAQALYFIDHRVSIVKIRRFIESGVEGLLQVALNTYFERNCESRDWQSDINVMMQTIAKGAKAPIPNIKLVASIEYYKDGIAKDRFVQSEAIGGLLSLFEHNREHFSKMIATLSPLLDMLTSGDMGKILSPDAFDIDDERPIVNLMRLAENGGVLYVGLNSLFDKTITNAIAQLLMSDAAATAGAIYSEFDKGFRTGKPRRISLIVDEGYVAMNESCIEILNKARGAGFEVTMATQTLADYAAKLGSTSRAEQVVGNFNNLVSLRITDEGTQQYVAKKIFGECWITSRQKSYGFSSQTETGLTDFTGAVQTRAQEALLPGFPPDLLGRLPNWQYVALFSGKKPIKGRFPVMID